MIDVMGYAALSKDEIRAVKALSIGKASEHQQTLGLAVIIKKLARTNALPFKEGSPDGTAFLAGRAFVGAEIHRIINMKTKD